MCGIVAYVGPRSAPSLLIDGLRRLEYRGYDSAGLAVTTSQGGLAIRRAVGTVQQLANRVAESPVEGQTGIAHTRWATHGAPTEYNAHPHRSHAGRVAVVHNGIIENATALRTHLERLGVTFHSETDTETLAHLIEQHWTAGRTLTQAVQDALLHVEGTYGLAVVAAEQPTEIVVARRGSPLLIGVGADERFIASDPSAVLAHTRQVVYLEDGDIATVTATQHTVTHAQTAEAIERPVKQIDWELAAIEKGGYAHFMLKEIMEQPETLRQTMRGRLPAGQPFPRLGGLDGTADRLARINRVVIVSCGTSLHAGHIGKLLIERYARLPVMVEYASEFRYGAPVVDDRTLCIAISQSGETADTLAAMREAQRLGAFTLGVVNAVGSTIARESDTGIYCHAGPEIGVASTKAFTSQVVALTMLSLHLGRLHGLAAATALEVVDALRRLPDQVAQVLETAAAPCAALGQWLAGASHALYLGRGFHHATALEGALKLKEISYIHAEGYAAAEMKHGPIALIDANMPVIVIAPHDGVFEKMVGNIREVKARGGQVVALTTRHEGELQGWMDHEIRLPETLDGLMPVLTAIPLQLLSYETAVARGCNVDQPRNLAKSVTVE